MICPKCHTPLDLPVNVCPKCGAGLQRSGGRLLVFTAVVVLVTVIGVYGYINYRFSSSHDEARLKPVLPSKESAFRKQEAPGSSGDAMPLERASITPLSINADALILKDITGGDLGKYPIAIASPGWFAFPGHFLIGAFTWQVVLNDGRSFAVEGAILQDGDPVGLWSVAINTPLDGPLLTPWVPSQPLRWHSLEDIGASREVQVSSFVPLGNFARLPLSSETNGVGMFTQAGNMVGWSFGDLAAGGFLWTGSPGMDLIPSFYTDDFYRLTFEGSREEALLLALSDPNLSDIQRLTALVEAHLLEARMSNDILPDRIAPPVIHQTMRRMVDALQKQNRTAELLALFDPQSLAAINHPPLIADLAIAAQASGGYADALDLLDMLARSTSGEAQTAVDFERMQTAVYRSWLDRLLAEGDVGGARSVYEEAIDRFAQDPAIQLVGVELLLLDDNWALAERRLAGRTFPPDLRDRVDRLEREIADAKSREGKILIRFRPGSRTVPIMASIGGTVGQSFLIDTGASVVTVPSETVRKLGIDLSGSLPRRLFFSATGVHNALEVTLPSIEIDGWAVADVKALVIDLPGKPGIGLLGMNYLRNFHMNLNAEEGLLTLLPH